MIIQKLKTLYHQLNKLSSNVSELLWANYFHDYTKNIEELKNLSLSPGRLAANYSLLYVLAKIIIEYNPEKILEFGLGESSKLISALIKNNPNINTHIILENDSDWHQKFISTNNLCSKSIVQICDIKTITFGKQHAVVYDIPHQVKEMKFDLYFVDGPKGSERYSRFNICELVRNFEMKKDFIIVFDDAQRKGEQDSIKDIHQILKENQISYVIKEYKGEKSQYVFATERYKYATSL